MDYFLYIIARCFVGFVNILPVSVALWGGRVIGRFFLIVDRRHRELVARHLGIAFGNEKSPKEIKTILRKNYAHMGMLLVEFCRQRKLTKENIGKVITEDGLAPLREALKEGKGVVMLGGHIGNWELTGFSLSVYGIPISAIARPLDNRYLNGFVDETRSRLGQRIIAKKGAIVHILRALKNGGAVGMIIDQNAGVEGTFAEFFGKEASTSDATALLAMKTGAPVLPVASFRDGNKFRHKFVIGDRIEIVNTGDVEADKKENLRRFNRAFENTIRQCPEQWLWVHKRWKTRPPGESPAFETVHRAKEKE